MGAKLGKEIHFTTPDQPGMAGKVTRAIGKAGVNIEALCAYGVEGKAYFMLTTEDNAKAMEAIKGLNYTPEEKDVILIEVDNKAGAAGQVTEKLGHAGILINYIYWTTTPVAKTLLVISTRENQKALKALA